MEKTNSFNTKHVISITGIMLLLLLLFTITAFAEPCADGAHVPGTPVQENYVAPDCIVDGGYDKVIYCSVPGCGVQISREYIPVQSSGHTPGTPQKENEIPATCQKAGQYDNVTRCTKCNAVISTTPMYTAPTEHAWVDSGVIKAATCLEPGEKKFTCSVCGATRLQSIPQGMHVYGNWEITRFPTCSSTGIKEVKCLVCGTKITQEIPRDSSAHNFINGVCQYCGLRNENSGISSSDIFQQQPGKIRVTYAPGPYAVGGITVREWDTGTIWLEGKLFYREGYTQTGWALSENGKKDYGLQEVVNAYGNITLYPYWQKNSEALFLTVNTSGEGTIKLSGGVVYNGWSGKLEPNQSFTFYFYPANDNYVYSILLNGKYRSLDGGNHYMVTYEMLQGSNQTMTVRFNSIYAPPKTGDTSNLALWTAFCLLSMFGCMGLIFRKEKDF